MPSIILRSITKCTGLSAYLYAIQLIGVGLKSCWKRTSKREVAAQPDAAVLVGEAVNSVAHRRPLVNGEKPSRPLALGLSPLSGSSASS